MFSIRNFSNLNSSVNLNRKYFEAGDIQSLELEKSLKLQKNIEETGLEIEFSGGVGVFSELYGILGSKVIREENKIVATSGLGVSARVGCEIGFGISSTLSNNDSQISADFSLAYGLQAGQAFLYKSNTIIDTKNWIIEFSTALEIDLEIMDFAVISEISGKLNISKEIKELTNEIQEEIKYDLNKELNPNKDLKENKENKENKEEIKKKILQNLPTWSSKIQKIKNLTHQKLKQTLTGFNNKVIEKSSELLKKVLKNKKWLIKVIEIGTNIAKKINNLMGSISSILIKKIIPTIDYAINEIKPTDIADKIKI